MQLAFAGASIAASEYTATFEGGSPLASLTHVEYSGLNPASSPQVVAGKDGGQGVLAGGTVFEGGTGGTAANTQYPAVFVKFPVAADAALEFHFFADFRILDEGAFSDMGLFIGRLAGFQADPAFYHVLLNVDAASSGVYYHADHGGDQRGDRPDGGGAVPYTGQPTPVSGTPVSGLAVGDWYRSHVAWSPAARTLSVRITQGPIVKGDFVLVLDGSVNNPNAIEQTLNAPLPPIVEFGIGTFNDGVIMDNISIIHGIPPGTGGSESTLLDGQSRFHAANAGWIDAKGAPGDGVVTYDRFLSGKAWAANIGWIDFGDGTPANGYRYSNTSGGDCGVNLMPGGKLEGLAYSANTGWLNFEQVHGKPLIDYLSGEIRGHAYSANLGWCTLDTPGSPLVARALIRPDKDNDGISDTWEMQYFGNLVDADESPQSNADGDDASDLREYLAGTDPRDNSNPFVILSHSYQPDFLSANVVFRSSPDLLYRIHHSDTLDGSWTGSALGLIRPDDGLSTMADVPLPGGTRRFLRVSSIQPLLPAPAP